MATVSIELISAHGGWVVRVQTDGRNQDFACASEAVARSLMFRLQRAQHVPSRDREATPHPGSGGPSTR